MIVVLRTWRSLGWLRRRQIRGVDLLVICSDCRDVLCIETLGDVRHRIGTVVAKSALPHRQLKGDVVFVLPGKIRNRREFAGAARSMAVVAGLKFLRRIPDSCELLAAPDERRICAR